MAIFSAIAARILRSKSSQASSLLSHATQETPGSIWALSSQRVNYSGSYSAQIGEHESRDRNSDQSTSFTCGKRSMYTDVSAARVGRRPSGAEETQVDALQGIQEMAADAGATAQMSIVLKSFEKIKPGRLQNVSKVGLPCTRVLFTVNRSPHVDKKSREQFEMKVRKKLLVMEMDVGKLREKYNLLKLHNMLGVQLKVNFHYKTRLDMNRLKKPDVMEEASTIPGLGEAHDRKQLEAQK